MLERGISVEQVSEFDRVLSVQPFWDADKLAKQLLVDKASGAPIERTTEQITPAIARPDIVFNSIFIPS